MSLKKGFAFCVVFLCQNILAQYQPITNLKRVINPDNILKNTSNIPFSKRFNDSSLTKNQSSLRSIFYYNTILYFKKIVPKWLLFQLLEKLYRNRIPLFETKSINP